MKEIKEEGTQLDRKVSELQTRNEEMSAVMELMVRISSMTNKREVIEQIRETFQIVFGASRVRFWSRGTDPEFLPEDIRELFLSMDQFLLQKEENRLCIKVQWDDKVYGVLEAKDFLFPERLGRYIKYARDIMNIGGVILSNLEQSEQISKFQKEIKYVSYHDSLTELFNRKYLNVLLERSAETSQMTVFAFDIDRMKEINDRFGHSEGDKLIRTTAEVLKNSLRETDLLARSGGDEFVAILPLQDRTTAEQVLLRIEEAIRLHNDGLEDPDLKISVSVGFALTEEDEGSLEELVQLADERMQENKMLKRRILH